MWVIERNLAQMLPLKITVRQVYLGLLRCIYLLRSTLLTLMQPKFKDTKNSALPVRVAIYIPSRTRAGDMKHDGISQDDLLKVVLNFFTFEFGGATAVEAKGYFVHPEKSLTQEEPVTIVYANASETLVASHMPTIEELANDLAVRLDQTSVAFEVGSTMYFASPTSRYRDINKWLLPKLLSGDQEQKRGWSKYVDIRPLVLAREKPKNEMKAGS